MQQRRHPAQLRSSVVSEIKRVDINKADLLGDATAQWIRLRPPTCLPRVRVPITSSPLLLVTVKCVLYLSCEKKENKQQKEADPGPRSVVDRWTYNGQIN